MSQQGCEIGVPRYTHQNGFDLILPFKLVVLMHFGDSLSHTINWAEIST